MCPSVKKVPTKEKLCSKDLYKPLQVGGLWEGPVGLATERKDSLISPGLVSRNGHSYRKLCMRVHQYMLQKNLSFLTCKMEIRCRVNEMV